MRLMLRRKDLRSCAPSGSEDLSTFWCVFLNKYRNRLQIIRDILLVAASGEGSRKTHIMYGANLSYKLVTRYLDEVLKAGLLEYDRESLYTLTCKGEKFLKLCDTYESNRKELECHLNDLENGKEILEKMLSA